MGGHHSHGVSHRSGHRKRHGDLEDRRIVGQIATGAHRHRRGDNLRQVLLLIDPTHHGLDQHLFRTQTGEVDMSADRHGRAEQGSVGQTGCVDVAHPHRRPGLVHLRPESGEFAGPGEVVVRHRVARDGRRRVELLGVVAHHARGQDLWPQGMQRVANHLHPSGRNPVWPHVVELGHHHVLEQLVQCGCLEIVAPDFIGDAVRCRDGPSVLVVGHLIPPSVEDGQVQPTVECRLHARGTARLHRP